MLVNIDQLNNRERRDLFMDLFRHEDFNEGMSADDCVEVFSTVLKGSSDITVELLNSVIADYGAGDVEAILSSGNYHKETALVATLIHHNGQLNGTVFQTFDKAYEIANAFVVTYGLGDEQWEEVDFEEVIVAFVDKYLHSE